MPKLDRVQEPSQKQVCKSRPVLQTISINTPIYMRNPKTHYELAANESDHSITCTTCLSLGLQLLVRRTDPAHIRTACLEFSALFDTSLDHAQGVTYEKQRRDSGSGAREGKISPGECLVYSVVRAACVSQQTFVGVDGYEHSVAKPIIDRMKGRKPRHFDRAVESLPLDYRWELNRFFSDWEESPELHRRIFQYVRVAFLAFPDKNCLLPFFADNATFMTQFLSGSGHEQPRDGEQNVTAAKNRELNMVERISIEKRNVFHALHARIIEECSRLSLLSFSQSLLADDPAHESGDYLL